MYTYDYEEMKIIVEGEFHISDQTGKKSIGLPGVRPFPPCPLRSPSRKADNKGLAGRVLLPCG